MKPPTQLTVHLLEEERGATALDAATVHDDDPVANMTK